MGYLTILPGPSSVRDHASFTALSFICCVSIMHLYTIPYISDMTSVGQDLFVLSKTFY